jgi:hypothetical protein
MPEDTIKIVNGNTAGGWDIYQIDAYGNWTTNWAAPDSTPVNQRDVSVMALMRIIRNSLPTYGFFAYNSGLEIALDGIYNTNVAYSTTVTLAGTNGNTTGFTQLKIPQDYASLNATPIVNPAADLGVGDLLYARAPGSLVVSEYWWDTSVPCWKEGGSVASAPVAAGTIVWVRRQSGPSATIAF